MSKLEDLAKADAAFREAEQHLLETVVDSVYTLPPGVGQAKHDLLIARMDWHRERRKVNTFLGLQSSTGKGGG